MTDYEAFLAKTHKNLSILQEREAKYAGNAPLDLLNQIDDHKQAITLTRRAIEGDGQDEIHVSLSDVCSYYLNDEGNIVRRGRGTACKDESELHLLKFWE